MEAQTQVQVRSQVVITQLPDGQITFLRKGYDTDVSGLLKFGERVMNKLIDDNLITSGIERGPRAWPEQPETNGAANPPESQL